MKIQKKRPLRDVAMKGTFNIFKSMFFLLTLFNPGREGTLDCKLYWYHKFDKNVGLKAMGVLL